MLREDGGDGGGELTGHVVHQEVAAVADHVPAADHHVPHVGGSPGEDDRQCAARGGERRRWPDPVDEVGRGGRQMQQNVWLPPSSSISPPVSWVACTIVERGSARPPRT